MARKHVVTALERKHARLLGCQLRLRQPSLSLAADLEHIKAVIRLFDPAWDKASVKPVAPKFPSRWRKGARCFRGDQTGAAAIVSKQIAPLNQVDIRVSYYFCFG